MPGRVSQSFLVVVLMLGMNVPVVEAQSDVVASALRRASGVEVAREAEVVQEGSTIRRRRSGALAGLGAGVAAAGVALFLGKPKCGHTGSASDFLGYSTYTLSGVYEKGGCDVAIDVSDPLFGNQREFLSDVNAGRGNYVFRDEVESVRVTEGHGLRYTGLALAGIGSAVLWFGMRTVDVPLRVELTPDFGILASRSFAW